MRKIRQYKNWGIYALSTKEQSEYGFDYAVIHPNNMGCSMLTPADSDMEMDSQEDAIFWIDNYEN